MPSTDPCCALPLPPEGKTDCASPGADATMGLSTLQRNALAQFLQRRDFTPQDIAQFDYLQIARLPKIGRKSLDAIRKWLRGHGYDLRNTPESAMAAAHQRGEMRVDKAVKLLRKHGYEIRPPRK